MSAAKEAEAAEEAAKKTADVPVSAPVSSIAVRDAIQPDPQQDICNLCQRPTAKIYRRFMSYDGKPYCRSCYYIRLQQRKTGALAVAGQPNPVPQEGLCTLCQRPNVKIHRHLTSPDRKPYCFVCYKIKLESWKREGKAPQQAPTLLGDPHQQSYAKLSPGNRPLRQSHGFPFSGKDRRGDESPDKRSGGLSDTSSSEASPPTKRLRTNDTSFGQSFSLPQAVTTHAGGDMSLRMQMSQIPIQVPTPQFAIGVPVCPTHRMDGERKPGEKGIQPTPPPASAPIPALTVGSIATVPVAQPLVAYFGGQMSTHLPASVGSPAAPPVSPAVAQALAMATMTPSPNLAPGAGGVLGSLSSGYGGGTLGLSGGPIGSVSPSGSTIGQLAVEGSLDAGAMSNKLISANGDVEAADTHDVEVHKPPKSPCVDPNPLDQECTPPPSPTPSAHESPSFPGASSGVAPYIQSTVDVDPPAHDAASVVPDGLSSSSRGPRDTDATHHTHTDSDSAHGSQHAQSVEPVADSPAVRADLSSPHHHHHHHHHSYTHVSRGPSPMSHHGHDINNSDHPEGATVDDGGGGDVPRTTVEYGRKSFGEGLRSHLAKFATTKWLPTLSQMLYPFEAMGKNSIVLYVGSEILADDFQARFPTYCLTWLWHHMFSEQNTIDSDVDFEALFHALTQVVIWACVAVFLDRHGAYFKI
eukprot:Rmarinus@m.2448